MNTCTFESDRARLGNFGEGVEMPYSNARAVNLVTVGDAAKVYRDRIAAANAALVAAGKPVRLVTFAAGERFSARRLFNAVEAIGGTIEELYCLAEGGGILDRGSFETPNGDGVTLTVYKVARDDRGALDVRGVGLIHRDYSVTTWNAIRDRQESYIAANLRRRNNMSDITGMIEYREPTAEDTAALAAIENKHAPVTVAPTAAARAIMRDIETWATVAALANIGGGANDA